MDKHLENIIQGCKAFNRLQQEQLYHYCYPQIFAVCERYTYNRDDAAILYNEGMLKLLSNINKFDNKGAFMGWARKIIVNCCIDHLRKETTYVAVQVSENVEPQFYTTSFIEEKISSQEVIKLLNQLPKNTNLVFNLYAIEGYKFEEIATLLNITIGTTKWHVSEARKKLKQLLQQYSKKVININAE